MNESRTSFYRPRGPTSQTIFSYPFNSDSGSAKQEGAETAESYENTFVLVFPGVLETRLAFFPRLMVTFSQPPGNNSFKSHGPLVPANRSPGYSVDLCREVRVTLSILCPEFCYPASRVLFLPTYQHITSHRTISTSLSTGHGVPSTALEFWMGGGSSDCE